MEPHNSHIPPIDEEILEDLYAWVDQIPLSRPKKNFARDFSDGAMVAEIVMHYFPKFVEIHNYPSATGTKLKTENWHTLVRKVLRKFNYEVSNPAIDDIANCRPYAIEHVLMQLRVRIDELLWERQRQITQKDAPEADQYTKSKPKKPVQKPAVQPAPKVVPVKAGQKPPAAPSTQQVKKQPQPTLSSQPPKRNPVHKSQVKEAHPVLTQKPPVPHHPPPHKGAEKKQQKILQGSDGSNMRSRKPSQDSMTSIPLWQYQEKEMECYSKDETIQMLQLKVGKLEQLLQLKDLRIQELESKPKTKGTGAAGKVPKGKHISTK